MFSKRSLEGHLMIDHRAVQAPRFEARPGLATAQPGQMFEAATITCNHCNRIVVLNPGRTRERGWCSKCDRYLCDECTAARAATGECRSVSQQLDEIEKAALSTRKGLIHHG